MLHELNQIKRKEGWPLFAIEECCLKVTSGGTPSRSNPAFYENGTIDWIKTGELKDWFVDKVSEKITEDAVRHSSAKVFPANTVLMAMYGDGRTIGRVGILRHPAATNQASCAMILDESKCVPKFLLYSLIYHRKSLISLALGGAQRNLNSKTIRAFKISVPHTEIQKKIVAALSAYDNLIENNTRRIQILEEIAGRIYEEWFVRFRFPGHESVKMIESELGFIPEGWEVKRLKDVCSLVQYGYTTSAKHEPTKSKFLRITDIVPPSIDWDAVPYCDVLDKDFEKYKLATGDIVIARTGATTGFAKRINKFHPASIFASYLVRIRANEGVSSHLLGVAVESEDYKQFVKANLGGAAQPQANAQVLTSKTLAVPPTELQREFDKIVESLIDQKEILQKKNLNLRRTRDLLLPKLISGEMDVSNFPEPVND